MRERGGLSESVFWEVAADWMYVRPSWCAPDSCAVVWSLSRKDRIEIRTREFLFTCWQLARSLVLFVQRTGKVGLSWLVTGDGYSRSLSHTLSGPQLLFRTSHDGPKSASCISTLSLPPLSLHLLLLTLLPLLDHREPTTAPLSPPDPHLTPESPSSLDLKCVLSRPSPPLRSSSRPSPRPPSSLRRPQDSLGPVPRSPSRS